MRLNDETYTKKYIGRKFETKWDRGKFIFKLGELKDRRATIHYKSGHGEGAEYVHESYHSLEDVQHYIEVGDWILEDQPIQIKLINITR